MPILLTEKDVKALLPMDDLITVMASALADFSAHRVTQPLRTVLEVGEKKSFYGLMPAYLPSRPALGTKLVTVFESNIERGLPTHLATIVLLDPQTGALLALLDGRYITEARTAAVSAVSVQLLARADATVLAIIGSGVQARSHLDAISRVRELSEVRVWSPTAARVGAFLSDMRSKIGATIVAADTAEQAVRGAGIIALTTSAKEPVVRNEWIDDGTHVCAVGACRPTQREMDAALVARSHLYVDSREAALAEAGDILLAIADGAIGQAHIRGEIGELVSGGSRGRHPRETVTIFKSLGMAVEDVAAASLVYERAVAGNVGTVISL
ncbi:MAG: ornithine cyclodeaminase family protein [Acidobacteria bacterium]|nr:ornithine cyclodeaminase family protein [Acidobacteriota bacterium]